MADETSQSDSGQPAKSTNDRRKGGERRHGRDRRKKNVPVAVDRRKGGERRVAERRRQVDPTTCERYYDDDEVEFMKAIEDYKRDFLRPFPTWSEVLEVVKALGYRKVAEPCQIEINRAKAKPMTD